MQATIQEQASQAAAGSAVGFLAGMFIGGLAAAGTMLLLAPQPGAKTRANLRLKGSALRDQASKSLGVRVSEARGKAGTIAATARQRFEELRQRGREIGAQSQDSLPAGICELPLVQAPVTNP